MNVADYIIIGALAFSLIFGLVRGFLREALGLLAWLGGLWLAWRYADLVKPLLGGLLAEEPLRTWVARSIILLTVVISGWLIAEALSYFIHQSGVSVMLDRVLGMLFGLIRGVVLVALFALVGNLVHLDETRWWKKSDLLPYAVDVSNWIAQFAETALRNTDATHLRTHVKFDAIHELHTQSAATQSG
jgi:membrane protein required for colicin V production